MALGENFAVCKRDNESQAKNGMFDTLTLIQGLNLFGSVAFFV